MADKTGRRGGWIQRALRRFVDEREESRGREQVTATLTHRGQDQQVRVSNISSSGAMVEYPHADIGEAVTLHLLDHGAVAGQVRWARDGRVGIHFMTPLK